MLSEVETEEQGCSSATSDTTASFLSRLKAPTQSDLMRKRKVRANNPPHTGARNKKPTDPKNIRAIDRVREFKDEMLTVSSGKLFCSACREELSLKLSIAIFQTHKAEGAGGPWQK